LAYAQTQERGMGLRMDIEAQQAYMRSRKTLITTAGIGTMSKAHSLKQYCPPVGNQGGYQTCTAWAAGYYTHTILDAIEKQKKPTLSDVYSPTWIYGNIKSKDYDCEEGSMLNHAFEFIIENGDAKLSKIPYSCRASFSDSDKIHAQNYKLKDFELLYSGAEITSRDGQVIKPAYNEKNKIFSTKKAIANNEPVVIAWEVRQSFVSFLGDTWIKPKNEQQEIKKKYHAMTVIAYDDQKNGGSFQLVNSWGENWGENGYAWVTYKDFDEFVFYGFKASSLKTNSPAVKEVNFNVQFRLLDDSPMSVTRNTNHDGTGGQGVKSKHSKAQYKFKNSYSSGTEYQFTCSINEAVYVYVIASDQEDTITRVFPLDNTYSALIPYKNSQFIFPSPDHYMYLDDNVGKEYTCILLSPSELNFDDLVDKMKRESGSFYEKVSKVLGSRAISSDAAATYQNDKIAVSMPFGNNSDSILPIFIELNHIE